MPVRSFCLWLLAFRGGCGGCELLYAGGVMELE
jgi:hypothetical protein